MILKGEDLTNDTNLDAFSRSRKSDYDQRTFKEFEVSSALEDGWEKIISKKGIEKKNPSGSQPLKKMKKQDICFENSIWMTLYKIGYRKLNKDRKFLLNPFEPDKSQIDVYGEDDDTILVFECKSANTPNTKRDFNKDIERFSNLKNKFGKKLVEYSGGKFVKFIFATHNYIVGDANRDRLKASKIEYWDDYSCSYHEKLANELRYAGKYQMLSILLKDEKIKSLNNEYAALKCEMGKATYYNFSITPNNLLKICTIPHRHQAFMNADPSYQRFVKSAKLKSVNKFIEEGHIFPNSIIVSINSKIDFKESRLTQKRLNSTKTGVIYLPKTFGSCNVIDGQHRIYGYAQNIKRSKNDSIPVIAFENLSDDEQMKIFTEINTNQKGVSKDVINDIKETLYRNSDDYTKVFQSYAASIARQLNTSMDSPLKGSIKIGENERTHPTAKITSESILGGIKDSFFFGVPSKYEIKESGLFFKTESKFGEMEEKTYKTLLKNFTYISKCFEEEWNLGSEGFLNTPHGIKSLIRISSEILFNLQSKHGLQANNEDLEVIYKKSLPYLKTLVNGINNLDDTDKDEIKKAYGGGGYLNFFRTFLEILCENHRDFNYRDPGYLSWLKDKPIKVTGMHAKALSIEEFLKDGLKTIFNKYYETQSEWELNVIPQKVYDEATMMRNRKNREAGNDKYNAFDDCFTFDNVINTMRYVGNKKELNKEMKQEIKEYFRLEGENDIYSPYEFVKGIRNKTSHISEDKLKLSPSDIKKFDRIYDFVSAKKLP
jgi:DNA sulfur modification protein DndB